MLVALFSAVHEVHCIEQSNLSTIQMQVDLMQRFYGGDRVEHIERFSTGLGIDAVCEWLGVLCRNGLVVSISYMNSNLHTAAIEYLPSTLQEVNLRGNRIEAEVDTRLLPRALTHLNLRNNLIFGTFNLATLPPLLRKLDVISNKIEHIGAVCHLPAKIAEIDFSNNKIKVKTIYVAPLPNTLKKLVFDLNQVDSIEPAPGTEFPSNVFVHNQSLYDMAYLENSQAHN